MFESVILGIVQGITEWIPISSEGALVLVSTGLFDSELPLQELIRFALLLHLGSFFAALWYFRKDVKDLILALFSKDASNETRKIFMFLLLSTAISGSIGLMMFSMVSLFEEYVLVSTVTVAAVIGVLLLITGTVQIMAKRKGGQASLGTRGAKDIRFSDGVILGLVQAMAVFPGFSRSGLTVSALIFRKFDEVQALRLSFLMSLPIILGGNVMLNFGSLSLTLEAAVGMLFAFLFGILTIHGLFSLARRINFGYFALFFGVLVLSSILFLNYAV